MANLRDPVKRRAAAATKARNSLKPSGKIREETPAKRELHELKPQFIKWVMAVACSIVVGISLLSAYLAISNKGEQYPYVLLGAVLLGTFALLLTYFGSKTKLQLLGTKAETQFH